MLKWERMIKPWFNGWQNKSLRTVWTKPCQTTSGVYNKSEVKIVDFIKRIRTFLSGHLLISISTCHFKIGSDFSINTSMSYTSSNLIYVIRRAGCGEKYIGQTEDIFRHSMTVHQHENKEPKNQCTPGSEHMRNYAKNKSPNLTVFPFS